MPQSLLLKSELPFPVRRGKVRDVYDLGDMLLIVATDRISAFDCVMPNGIPDKGRILTSSPIGQGLIGRKKGETVEIQVPSGKIRFKVLEISAASI